MMFGLIKRDDVSEIMKSHNLLSTKQLQFKEIAVGLLMFRLSTNSLPRPFLSMFQNKKLYFKTMLLENQEVGLPVIAIWSQNFAGCQRPNSPLNTEDLLYGTNYLHLKNTRSLKSFVKNTHEYTLTKL